MSGAKGSVRIGPISLFTLTIILCLAVLAVLAVTTAQATYAAAEKQASFTTDTYTNEAAAQQFVADVDTALAPVRASGGGLSAALDAVEGVLPDEAQLEDSTVHATFTTESGRTLDISLTIRADATYDIDSWKATTQWTESGSGTTLWSGSAQSR